MAKVRIQSQSSAVLMLGRALTLIPGELPQGVCTGSEMEKEIMQEEANQKTVGIAVQGTKMTARVFMRACEKFLQYRKEQKRLKKQDPANYKSNQPKRVKVSRLVREGDGVSSIEIKDESIKEFEKLARKNGVRYAVKKDKTTSPPTYYIFFKGKNAEVIDNTLREYTKRQLTRGEKKPVIHDKLENFKKVAKEAAASKLSKVKNKQQER